MHESGEKLSDEDFLVEFDNLVNLALSRSRVSYLHCFTEKPDESSTSSQDHKIKTSSTREFTARRRPNGDETELDISEIYQLSEDELSKPVKPAKKLVRPKRHTKDLLPSLLNDLILVLVKYLNRNCKSLRRTSRLDLKCVRLMNKKAKIATVCSCLAQLMPQHNTSSQIGKSKKKRRPAASSSSMSSLSSSADSITSSNSSMYMMSTDIDYRIIDDSAPPIGNDNKWMSQLEIPNIEDPLLFIDTLYNQLLANNNSEEVSKQLVEARKPDLNSSAASFSDSSLECNEALIPNTDTTLNNELSLIDYSYLIGDHMVDDEVKSTRSELDLKDYYIKLNANLIDWNYEETMDFEESRFTSNSLNLSVKERPALVYSSSPSFLSPSSLSTSLPTSPLITSGMSNLIYKSLNSMANLSTSRQVSMLNASTGQPPPPQPPPPPPFSQWKTMFATVCHSLKRFFSGKHVLLLPIVLLLLKSHLKQPAAAMPMIAAAGATRASTAALIASINQMTKPTLL